MAKICHIFYDCEHTQRFMPFFRDSFPEHQHSIVFAGGSFWDPVHHKPELGVVYTNLLLGSEAEPVMREADKILFHSIFCREPELGRLLLEEDLLRKSVWIPWGADLFYATNLEDPVAPDSIFGITMSYRIEFMRRVSAICSGAYEYNVAVAVSGTTAVHFETYLPLAFNLDEMIRSFPADRKKATAPLTIWVGNSATSTNRHLDAFQKLRTLTEGLEFRVVCPLSYGDKFSTITAAGREYFGDKFSSLDKILSVPEFISELDKSDIVLMNHIRPQGFGSILMALLLGKFVVTESLGTQHWLETYALPHFQLSELLRCSKEYLIQEASHYQVQNRQKLSHLYSTETLINTWRRVLSPG
jgi:4-alpha-L-fucosyltransferase glycosyl transferase group 56